MKPHEKAHQTMHYRAARELIEAIASIEQPTPEQIIEIFKQHPAKPSVKCDAFWLMDNEPGRWSNRDKWHPYLRSVRNTPVYGEQLFETFRSRT